MGPVSRPRSRARSEGGFTLLEVVVAMGILSVALLSLVGVFATGLRRVGSSSNQLIAREKAREAIESVHAARDTGRVSWDSVRNVADGGIFLPGALPLTKPGADGIVGTADDGAVETVQKPGPDGILGNTDDEIVTLTNFSREVILTPLNFPNTATVNPTLRQVTVNIRYLVDNTWRTYTLTTYRVVIFVSTPMPRPKSSLRRQRSSDAGFTLLELLVAMGLMTVVMAITLGGLSDATKANEAVMNLTSMNNSIRIGMDMMVRDLLQVGSGLPPSHVVLIPSGANSSLVRIPGPPGTAFTLPAGTLAMDAVVPLPGVGPTINGTPTDVVVLLAADNTFVDQSLTAITSTSVDIAAGTNIATGPDRVTAGQLMMVSKGSTTTLLEVTAVDTTTRRLTFAASDSLNLNQPAAAAGTLAALNAVAPANTPSSARISRIRMIGYYLDSTTDPQHPRLVRRVNNGHPTTFNNLLGNAVATDIENLQFTYDLVDGVTNPADVRMVAADLAGTGRCSPNPCTGSQIRKINIALAGRSQNAANAKNRIYRNTLSSEVSFRGMAFVNDYQAP